MLHSKDALSVNHEHKLRYHHNCVGCSISERDFKRIAEVLCTVNGRRTSQLPSAPEVLDSAYDVAMA